MIINIWKESINILRVCIAIIIKGTISGRNQLISLHRLLNLTGFRLVITCSLAKLKVVIAAAGSNLINLRKLMQWMNWIKSIKNSFQNKNNGHSTYFEKNPRLRETTQWFCYSLDEIQSILKSIWKTKGRAFWLSLH